MFSYATLATLKPQLKVWLDFGFVQCNVYTH